MCEANYALNRDDRVFGGTFGKLLAQKWPRRESSRREEHHFLFRSSLSPSQSPQTVSFVGSVYCAGLGQVYSPGASNICISYHSLFSPLILFFILSNKQMKNHIAFNQLGNLSDRCLKYEDSHQCHEPTHVNCPSGAHSRKKPTKAHCNNVLHRWTVQLMKKWTQKIVAGQVLLSQTHKRPPGKYKLLFFPIPCGPETVRVLGRCEFMDVGTDPSGLINILSIKKLFAILCQ